MASNLEEVVPMSGAKPEILRLYNARRWNQSGKWKFNVPVRFATTSSSRSGVDEAVVARDD
jgi:hypothetical protein